MVAQASACVLKETRGRRGQELRKWSSWEGGTWVRGDFESYLSAVFMSYVRHISFARDFLFSTVRTPHNVNDGLSKGEPRMDTDVSAKGRQDWGLERLLCEPPGSSSVREHAEAPCS